MYQTMWIDILSGKENETYEAVKERMARFKQDKGIKYAEIGMVFEEFDIFAVFEMNDTELLLDFILDEVAPLDGVVEIKVGNLYRVSKPLEPLKEKAAAIREVTSREEKVFTKVRGHSFYLIYLDALPSKYPSIYEELGKLDDPHIRYYAYCLDSYEEDLLVCLAMENHEEVRHHILETLRNIKGMWDTRSLLVNNVEFL
jgi:DNA-binding Lrp family transcriptional regulator